MIYSEPANDKTRGRALVVKWKQSELELDDIKQRIEARKAQQKERYMKRRREKNDA